MKTKLTVRVPRELLDNAKRYASAHNTTLTELIAQYFRRFPTEAEALDDAPVTRGLTGLLSPEASVEDFKEHLEEKYGG